MAAILGAVAIIIPIVFFLAGGPSMFVDGASNLTQQQGNFFSSGAFLKQGAPYIAAVLAYAIGNETVGYGATIIGALSSTADSDLAALSSIAMADIYG